MRVLDPRERHKSQSICPEACVAGVDLPGTPIRDILSFLKRGTKIEGEVGRTEVEHTPQPLIIIPHKTKILLHPHNTRIRNRGFYKISLSAHPSTYAVVRRTI